MVEKQQQRETALSGTQFCSRVTDLFILDLIGATLLPRRLCSCFFKRQNFTLFDSAKDFSSVLQVDLTTHGLSLLFLF